MSGRILVTGGAGFIGSHLVDQLVASCGQVTVLDDLSVGAEANLSDAMASGQVRFIKGSICDEAAVMTAMDGCDRVYHLAVQCVRRSLGNPVESHDINATGTLVLLEAARQRKIERFVYCSSSEVYGNTSESLLHEDSTICRPMTAYGAAKLAGEHYTLAYLRTYGLPAVVVRPFNAYGPRAYQTGIRAEVLPRFVARVVNGKPPLIFGDGEAGRDFTYITEIADGIRRAGLVDKAVGETINVAFGNFVSVRDLAEMVTTQLDAGDLGIEWDDPRPGDVFKLNADTTKAQSLLDYKATISIADGVAAYIDWFKTQFSDPSALLNDTERNW